jgi:signal transduction histidine kinase
VLAILPMDFNEPRWLAAAQGALGAAELKHLSVAIWADDGRRIIADHEGEALPFRAGQSGFVDLRLDGEQWHVYYLHPADSRFSIAVGQSAHERHELLAGLLTGQLLPWALMLPVLLVAMTVAVRHVLKPVREVAHEIEYRRADDLRPVALDNPPAELKPLLAAMNRLFARIGESLEHERRLTADAAHELRTPLAALKLQLDLARRNGAAAGGQAALDDLEAGVARASHVVEQLLTLARVEPEAMARARTQCDLATLARDAVVARAGLAAAKSIDLGLVRADAATVDGEPANLAILLSNLLDNALRYTPRGGRIDVAVEQADDGATLVVADSGPGIPADERARVFDRFVRGRDVNGPGSGLGLSIVKRIADAHHATVTLDTPAEGGGLAVRVRFPKP